MQLIAKRKCAFGNGTRNAGFVFGTFEINKGVQPFEFRKEVVLPKSLSDLQTGKVQLSEGVSDREFANAFRNGHLTLQLPKGSEAESQPTVQSQNPGKPSGDYKSILVSETSLSASIKSSLATAELKTLGDLETFANLYEGFTSIAGIGEAGEQDIINELAKHIK